jgi:ERF superfamily
MSIYKKLHTIQTQVLGLGKDKDGSGYKYVTGSKVLDHIKPLMNKEGLLLKQEILSIDNERQDYHVSLNQNQETKVWSGKPKSEILSKVMMRFTWIDIETGEKDENLFGANGQNDWDKGVGSALTYAERYFLLKYFHISTDEDDIDNPERKAEELKEQQEAEKAQKAETERLTQINKDLIKCKTEEALKEAFLKLTPEDQKIFSKLVTDLKLKISGGNK